MIPPYAKIYDPALLSDLTQWFAERKGLFPATLTLGKGMEITDLPSTIERYLELLPLVKDNPTFGAQLHHLFRIRGMLQEQGF